MKNKRGDFWLGEETAKMILALLGILVLVGFGILLYTASSQDITLTQAKSSLNYIDELARAGATQAVIFSPSSFISVTNPNGYWFLSSFSKSQNNLPKKCSLPGWESCICICQPEDQLPVFKIHSASQSCDYRGECIESDFSVSGDIFIMNPPLILSINQNNKIISENTHNK